MRLALGFHGYIIVPDYEDLLTKLKTKFDRIVKKNIFLEECNLFMVKSLYMVKGRRCGYGRSADYPILLGPG